MRHLVSDLKWMTLVLLRTTRGRRKLGSRVVVVFGFASAVVQLLTSVYVPSHTLSHAPWIILGIAVLSLLVALGTSWPKRILRREFGNPEMEICVKVGDLFAEDSQIVVGFSDTFDTDTSDDRIIDSHSVQGILLQSRYDGDSGRLDTLLDTALATRTPAGSTSATKPGKQVRYPIGTVAVIKERGARNVYGLAYTTMGDNLVVKSSIHDLWTSLNSLWDAVYEHGTLRPIAIPLVGTQLARIQCLDRETILRMILLSFVARAREQKVSAQFTVVVTEKDWKKMNPLEIEAFLATL